MVLSVVFGGFMLYLLHVLSCTLYVEWFIIVLSLTVNKLVELID